MKKTTRNMLIVTSSFASLFALTAGLLTNQRSITKEAKADGVTTDLSTLTGDHIAQDGETLTGTMTEHHKISIEDGATVTLQDVNINLYSYSDNKHQYAGIGLLGDAKLILSGNNVVSTHHSDYAAIFVPNNKTITIDAVNDTASLELNAADPSFPNEHAYGSCGAGIGANATTPCGNIIIEKGIINAYTCHGAGIGAGGFYGGDCGFITVNGGTITSYGDAGGGIGGTDTASAGNITINGGNVTAIGNHYVAGIGGGKGHNCGDILITGGIVTATGNGAFPGIGGGASCGNITIMDTVALVTATKGQTSMYSVGPSVTTDAGDSTPDGTCGTITIGGEVTEPITTNPFVYPILHTHDWSYTASGASITATCGNEDCPVTSGLILALVAPTNLVFDGSAKTASFEAGYSSEAFGTPTIEYFQNESLVGTCVNAGAYEARVTVGGATAKLQFEITQATPSYVVPTGLASTYGNKLSSVTLPEHWSWKNPNDLVGNVGDRTHVAIYTPEDPNYHSVEENVTIAVAKANPTYVVPSTIDAPYDVELSTIGLPEGFSWMEGTQKTSTWGESTFKAKYTPSDTVNYNIVENIDIKVNVKWILVDPTEGDVSVTIKDGETEYNVDISVKVEVKTEVTVDEKRTEYASIGREFIKQDEDINAIYSVKLIRTVGGVQTEIQPSDIKEGTKIIVSMPVPEELVSKPFRLLEIFSTNEAKEMENYALSKDGKTLAVEVDRMGEFAFVSHSDVPNGFDYSTVIPGWAIALIIVGSILLLCLLCFFLLFFVFNKWIRKDDKALRAVKFGKKDNKVRLLVMPFRFEYRQEAEVFDTKQEALKE